MDKTWQAVWERIYEPIIALRVEQGEDEASARLEAMIHCSQMLQERT